MSDEADRELAQQAYAIVRGSVRGPEFDLPHWDDLTEPWRGALQFMASHVAVTLEARIAALEEAARAVTWYDCSDCDGDYQEAIERLRSLVAAP